MQDYYQTEEKNNKTDSLKPLVDSEPHNSIYNIEEKQIDNDSKMIYVTAISVFIIITALSTGLFYYLKNQSSKVTKEIAPSSDLSILPKPETAKAAPVNPTPTQSTTPATTQPPSQKTGISHQTKTLVKEEIVYTNNLAITTIAPGNGNTVTGNKLLVAFTTSNPSFAYYDWIEYEFKNGTTSRVPGNTSIPNQAEFRSARIIEAPILSNVKNIKIMIHAVDIFNQNISQQYSYQVI